MTDVSTTLPQLDLVPNTRITVTLSDSAARITTLVIHGVQFVPDADGSIEVLPILLAHEPTGQ